MKRSKKPMPTYQADVILSRYDAVPRKRAEMENLVGICYPGKLNGKPFRFYEDKQLYRVSERLLNEAREVKSSEQDRIRQEVEVTNSRKIEEANRRTNTLVDKLAASPALLWGEHGRLCDYHNIPREERSKYTLAQLQALLD